MAQQSREVAAATERGRAQREARRKGGGRGEALDCRVYACAPLQTRASMGLSLERGCERAEMLAAKAHAQQAPRVSYSRWMCE